MLFRSDVRFRKLMTILFRSLFLNKNNALKTYGKSYEKTLVDGTERKFFAFTDEYLKPVEVSWRRLKSLAKEAVACFSGSDQIWNSSTLYVDPLYYLRFAPKQKRIALSPSFGRNFIADYNKNKMKKWINDYPYLSVREDSGVKLIKELTGLEAQHLLDPTLIINSEEWRKNLHIEEKIKNYILAYFLDEPSSHAKNALKALKEQLNCKVIALPYKFEDMDYCEEAVGCDDLYYLCGCTSGYGYGAYLQKVGRKSGTSGETMLYVCPDKRRTEAADGACAPVLIFFIGTKEEKRKCRESAGILLAAYG